MTYTPISQRRSQVSRRHFVTHGAGALTMGFTMSFGLTACSAQPSVTTARETWFEQAMGASVALTVDGLRASQAELLFDRCAHEIKRLEAIFYLRDPTSLITRLNQEKTLKNAPEDFLHLIRISQDLHAHTGGAFDPTVQPLWDLYAAHYESARAAQEAGVPVSPPSDTEINTARTAIGMHHIRVDGSKIYLTHPQAALTLNALAQGYVTDRLHDILKSRGVRHALIHAGEFRAIGTQADGTPWPVLIADPRIDDVLESLPLTDRALATSGGYGTQFDQDGLYHHIFDTQTGRSAGHYLSLSVLTDQAVIADGLATAFYTLPEADIRRMLHARPGTEVRILRRDGTQAVLNGPA